MNYEEKIKDFHEWLRSRNENALEKYKQIESETYDLTSMNFHGGRVSAFFEVHKYLEEIFGASERSGVGENEEVKEDFWCGQDVDYGDRCQKQCDKCNG